MYNAPADSDLEEPEAQMAVEGVRELGASGPIGFCRPSLSSAALGKDAAPRVACRTSHRRSPPSLMWTSILERSNRRPLWKDKR